MRNQKHIEEYVHKHNQERLDKLPKWAQSLVSVLAMRAHEAEARVDEILADKPGRVVLGDHRTGNGYREVERSLGDRASIKFYLKDPSAKDSWKYTVECRLRNDMLEVRTNGSSLIVSPQASNVIGIHSADQRVFSNLHGILEKAGE